MMRVGVCLTFVWAMLSAAVDAQWSRYEFKTEKALRFDETKLTVIAPDADDAFIASRLAAAGLKVRSIETWPVPGVRIVHLDAPLAGAEAALPLLRKIKDIAPGLYVSPTFIDDLGGPLVVQRTILVGCDEGLAPADAEAIAASVGTILTRTFAGMKNAFAVAAFAENGADVIAAANGLARRHDVRFAEPDWLCTLVPDYIPGDPNFGFCWQIENSGQLVVGLKDLDMDVSEAWDLSLGSGRVTVAVLDDGIQFEHPDLSASFGADVTSQGPGLGAPVGVFDAHGTLVAGAITGIIDNGIGAVGCAPGVRVISIRTFMSTGIGQAIFAGSWTANSVATAQAMGARVTNSSYTAGISSAAAAAAFQATHLAGMLHFAAAGNNAATTNQITFPANIPDVHAMTGLDIDFSVLWFATTGPGIAFAAPATYIETTDLLGPAGFDATDYVHPQGTSFASAAGSSIAALIWSVNPNLTANDVDTLMLQTATDLGAPGYDPSYGNGCPNAFGATWRAAMMLPDPTEVIFGLRGGSANDHTGEAAIAIGDFDADGRADFGVGSPKDDTAAIDGGRFTVVSGKTGQTLFAQSGSVASGGFGTSASAGDLDGNGSIDLAIGAPDESAAAGRVLALAGPNGASLWSVLGQTGDRLGAAVRVIGDVNGDGKADVVVGEPGRTINATALVGRIRCLSGATGAVLWTLDGNATRGERGFGARLLRIPDRTGDGIDDLVVGAPTSAVNGTDCGLVVIANGATGGRILTRDGFAAGDRLGTSMAATNDIDADGKAEILVGAPGSNLQTPGGGALFLIITSSGALVPAFGGQNAQDAFATAIATADVDGDGALDSTIGAPGDDIGGADAGRLFVYSGHNGAIAYDLQGGIPGQRLGAVAENVGDVDGDGNAEVIASALATNATTFPGTAVIFPAHNPKNDSALEPFATSTLQTILGRPYDVLFVNGQAGGYGRVVDVPIGGEVAFTVQQPISSTLAAPFAIYGMIGVPSAADQTPLPFQIGTMVLTPCPLAPSPDVFTLTSNLFVDPCALVPSGPTPWRFEVQNGLPFAFTMTLQGLLYDLTSGWKITNAVTLNVY